MPLDLTSVFDAHSEQPPANQMTAARVSASETLYSARRRHDVMPHEHLDNLQMLGEVALNEEEYSPKKQNRFKSRKSLADTISALKESSRMLNDVTPAMEQSATQSVRAKHHRRKVSPMKRCSPNKRARTMVGAARARGSSNRVSDNVLFGSNPPNDSAANDIKLLSDNVKLCTKSSTI